MRKKEKEKINGRFAPCHFWSAPRADLVSFERPREGKLIFEGALRPRKLILFFLFSSWIRGCIFQQIS
jgi:hypothetical protein